LKERLARVPVTDLRTVASFDASGEVAREKSSSKPLDCYQREAPTKLFVCPWDRDPGTHWRLGFLFPDCFTCSTTYLRRQPAACLFSAAVDVWGSGAYAATGGSFLSHMLTGWQAPWMQKEERGWSKAGSDSEPLFACRVARQCRLKRARLSCYSLDNQ
jgi:hypothetical protein